jgi:hypothetical protein
MCILLYMHVLSCFFAAWITYTVCLIRRLTHTTLISRKTPETVLRRRYDCYFDGCRIVLCMRLIYSLSIDGSIIEGGGCRGKSQSNGGGQRLRQRRRGSWIFYNMGSCAVMSWIDDSPFDRHPIKKKKWYDKSIKKCPFRKCGKSYAKGGIFNSNACLPPFSTTSINNPLMSLS